MNSQHSAPRSQTAVRRAATMVGVVMALGITGFAAPTALAGQDPNSLSERVTSSSSDQTIVDKAQVTVSGKGSVSPITRANAALTRATRQINAHHPHRAMVALRKVRIYVGKAHLTGMHLIGAPPADPESDEPPGPGAVLSVLALEHRVGVRVVPLFNGRGRADLVHALRVVLVSTSQRRDVMLNTVLALPPEGAGDDYTDGMSDTLPQYGSEVQQLSSALATYRLTPGGRVGLQNALVRARATEAKVNAAYGGGE